MPKTPNKTPNLPKKILIANRGEIACRIIKTAQKMGIKTVAVYSTADALAKHTTMADEAVFIGPAPSTESYLMMDTIIKAVKKTGADAVHPGYGFLSENKQFAQKLKKAGVIFIGPNAHAIEQMGDKITSKKIAIEAGVSTVPGFTGVIDDDKQAVKIANEIGYPVMIKASAGGGGKGMRVANNDLQTIEGFAASKSEAASSFGDDRIFIEKFITSPRHIEIQILGDTHGNCIHLNERECSIQRRNQKVIEEAPSPFLDAKTRTAMGAQAIALAQSVGYSSAGTVEFIVDAARNFYFLEMNTRLQVEHPITEMITGVDLVEQMIRSASGAELSLTQADIKINGWAIESRLYAEDPYRNFLPSVGRLTRYRPPVEKTGERAIRNDTGVYEGGEISVYYDPMIAKLCTWAGTRAEAIDEMRSALDHFEIEGIRHNLPFLSAVMAHEKFIKGEATTAFIEEEYADGFAGVSLSKSVCHSIAACASAMFRLSQIRAARISGRLDNHRRHVGENWVVTIDGQDFKVCITPIAGGASVLFDNGERVDVVSDWLPGQTLARFYLNDELFVLKVDHCKAGFRLRAGGADVRVYVRSNRVAELARLMPPPFVRDTSDLLVCPMPGLMIDLAVCVGDVVEEGQALCTLEAMKMENILRAEKRKRIVKINAEVGDSLAVDAVIMEFSDSC